MYEASQITAAADWPKDLMGKIKCSLNATSIAPRAPDLYFKMDSDSAQKNFLFIAKHALNLSKALLAQKGSPLDYGSELKPVTDLKRVFGRHPNWRRMEKIYR